jgi:hypothetical protein
MVQFERNRFQRRHRVGGDTNHFRSDRTGHSPQVWQPFDYQLLCKRPFLVNSVRKQ